LEYLRNASGEKDPPRSLGMTGIFSLWPLRGLDSVLVGVAARYCLQVIAATL